MRFIGDYIAKTDSKGRVFLPAQLRKILEQEGEERMILRPDLFQPCLVLYPESLWNEMLDDMRNRLNRYNAQHQAIMRQFVADAEVVELDSNGRFLMNKRKLQYAGRCASWPSTTTSRCGTRRAANRCSPRSTTWANGCKR